MAVRTKIEKAIDRIIAFVIYAVLLGLAFGTIAFFFWLDKVRFVW